MAKIAPKIIPKHPVTSHTGFSTPRKYRKMVADANNWLTEFGIDLSRIKNPAERVRTAEALKKDLLTGGKKSQTRLTNDIKTFLQITGAAERRNIRAETYRKIRNAGAYARRKAAQ